VALGGQLAHPQDVLGRVGEVAVDEDDVGKAKLSGALGAGAKRGAVAAILGPQLHVEGFDPLDQPGEDLGAGIGAAVVDRDHYRFARITAGDRGDLAGCSLDPGRLVEDRNDDPQRRRTRGRFGGLDHAGGRPSSR
jgi:hypothetical protein